VAPGGVNSGRTTAVAGPAAAEATPIAALAMVKANVRNTPRLPVMSFIAANPVMPFRQIGSRLYRDE
jgi:hypothetical protein